MRASKNRIREQQQFQPRTRKSNNNLIVRWGGPPCPRCHRPMQVREHEHITEKLLKKPYYYYSRWYGCLHLDCKTTLVMPEEFKVLNPGLYRYA